MLFAHYFKDCMFRPETLIISTQKNTIYKKYCDSLEKNVLLNLLKNTKDNKYWFCKPPGRSSGKGIIITKNPSELYDKSTKSNIYILEKEIEPYLLKNRKFDFRIHLLFLWKDNNLEVYFPKNFIARFASNVYDIVTIIQDLN